MKNECPFCSFAMSERFTPQHRFLIAAWYKVFRSPIVVQRYYRERFGPSANVPSPASIKAIHERASVHGTLQELARSGRRSSSTENAKLVMENVSNCPTTSTRRTSRELLIPRSTVQRIFHQNKLQPYKLRQLHDLSEEDHQERRQFAEDFGEVRAET